MMIQSDFHIFQGGQNHQPEYVLSQVWILQGNGSDWSGFMSSVSFAKHAELLQNEGIRSLPSGYLT